jgi:hypothetical protein
MKVTLLQAFARDVNEKVFFSRVQVWGSGFAEPMPEDLWESVVPRRFTRAKSDDSTGTPATRPRSAIGRPTAPEGP